MIPATQLEAVTPQNVTTAPSTDSTVGPAPTEQAASQRAEINFSFVCCHGCFRSVTLDDVLPEPMREFHMPICTKCEKKAAGLTYHLRYPAPAGFTPAPFRGWKRGCGCYSEECDGHCGPWGGYAAWDRVKWYVDNPDQKFRADEGPLIVRDAQRLRDLMVKYAAGEIDSVAPEDDYCVYDRMRRLSKLRKPSKARK